jgi:polyphosphate kinase
MPEISTDRYFDRELSWIDFNARVLAEAMNESNPLMERLKFMGIVSSNFDEFFMVRVASISDYDKILGEIYRKAFALMDVQNACFVNTLVPKLAEAGIHRIRAQELSDKQLKYVQNIFHNEVMPLLTPIAIRDEQPLPVLANAGTYVIVRLAEQEKKAAAQYAIVEIPGNYPRMITLPTEQGYAFILVEDVVAMMAHEFFSSFQVSGHGLFHVIRASDLTIDEENDEDFAKVMTEALRIRRKNFIARLDIAAPDEITDYLVKKLKVPEMKVYRHRGWFDLKTVARLAFQPVFEELKRPVWVPRGVPDFERTDDLWALLRQKDVMVHHPYESFDAFLRFLTSAAEDPDVLAIKQTLYRVGDLPPVVSILEKAAEKGKQVTVLVELKARFEEQRNIRWAERLMNAGATVLYGVAGMKTHAKSCLVVRREPEGIRRYLHLSTGNYNDKTASLYTDIGYFTSQEDLTRDVAAFFNVITGYSHPSGFSKIDIAPYQLRSKLRRLILRETMRSRKDESGLIIAKMNSLVDQQMIEVLYQASQAGVKIKLNVRGVCCLRPGVPGLSENIEVVSIVDMFLEHSRIFYFYNGGDEEVYLSSADWMPRNLDCRLEIMFPVEDPKNKKTLIETLQLYFKDNTQSWLLQSSGEYKRRDPGQDKRFRVQEMLCRKAAENEIRSSQALLRELKPQRPKNNL